MVLKLNGAVICDSRAIYGGGSSTAMSSDGSTWETINAMTECETPVRVKKGDFLTLEANYDLVKHPP